MDGIKRESTEIGKTVTQLTSNFLKNAIRTLTGKRNSLWWISRQFCTASVLSSAIFMPLDFSATAYGTHNTSRLMISELEILITSSRICGDVACFKNKKCRKRDESLLFYIRQLFASHGIWGSKQHDSLKLQMYSKDYYVAPGLNAGEGIHYLNPLRWRIFLPDTQGITVRHMASFF